MELLHCFRFYAIADVGTLYFDLDLPYGVVIDTAMVSVQKKELSKG